VSVKNKQNRKVFVTILFIFVCSIVFLTQTKIDKLDVNDSKLNIGRVEIPKEFSCDWYETTFDWDYHEVLNERWFEYYVANSNDDIKAFQWSDEHEGAVIHLAIVDYKYPITATNNYFLLDTAARKKQNYPNNENKNKLVLTNRTWINRVANQETFQCGTGTEEKCYGWFYRARYGQYYLQIEASGPTCYQYFEQVVAAINNQFIDSIENKK
jgi:hypothetical protein